VSRVTDLQRTAEIDGAPVLHRCGSCDVTWRGTTDITCWFCDSPGVAATEARIVEDEPAA